MYFKYDGVRHEAIFEVNCQDCEPLVVRQPFHDAVDSEHLGNAVARLLNRPDARERCVELHGVLGKFLYAHGPGQDAVQSVTYATRVIEVIELLTIETEQFVS